MIGLSLSTPDNRIAQANDVLKIIKAGEPVTFDNYTIVGELNLSILRIDSPVHFNNTLFRNSVKCNSTVFSNAAYFRYSNFNGNAYFSDSTFNQTADFGHSKFNGDAYFKWYSKFNGTADFELSTFNQTADFGHSKFNGDAHFWNCNFKGDAYFGFSNFNGYAGFSGSKFNGDADFRYSNFNFQYVEFYNSKFNGLANFWHSSFNGKAEFVYSNFNGGADFASSNFNGPAWFIMSVFSLSNFNDANFNNITGFNDSQFVGEAIFDNAKFSKTLYLTRTRYDKIYIRWYNINGGLGYDDATYMSLLKNFKDLGYFEDYDSCYFQYRKEHRGQPWPLVSGPDLPIRKGIDVFLEWFYGYGTKPLNALYFSVAIIIVFGIFWRTIGLGGPNDVTVEADFEWEKPVGPFDILSFSTTVFLSGTKLFIDPPTIPKIKGRSRSLLRKAFTFERILGAFFSILFFLAISGTVIR